VVASSGNGEARLVFRGIVGALFVAAGGAIIGSLFDSYGDHTHAQTLGLIGAVAGFIYGKKHI
jgi:hypothetical protein